MVSLGLVVALETPARSQRRLWILGDPVHEVLPSDDVVVAALVTEPCNELLVVVWCLAVIKYQ